MDITSRPVTPDDTPFLLTVYASAREDELAGLAWPPEARRAFLEQQFAVQQRAYAERFPDADHRVVMLESTPIGAMRIARGDTEIRLVDIALLAEHRGQGIGSVLLGRLQAEAAERCVPLRHAVEARNSRAHRFYERLGFRVVADAGVHVQMEWRPAE
jgi:ribosomal protein S18 acetylase RimI-like enzyme